VLRGSGLLRGNLGQMDQQLPEFFPTLELEPVYPAIGPKRGKVALFHGCLQNQTDGETLSSSIAVLTAFGYEVQVPVDQVCCGGLHLHTGKHDDAAELAHKNILAFGSVDAVVGAASGCGAVLKYYGQTLPQEGAEEFGRKYQDLVSFIAELDWPDNLAVPPLSGLALVHEPCSHRNTPGQQNLVYRLLERIPSLRVEALADNQFCCGGAGAYALTEPNLARQMREPKLAALANLNPQYLVTTNIGCALHLKAGLNEFDVDTEIVHPVTLLARQLASLQLHPGEIRTDGQVGPDAVTCT
jgi:glycolate oxidase iron-sulfur subunit